MWISNADFSPNHTKDAFYRFTRTTGGLAKGYTGANTGLYNPTALFLDAANSEIWLVNNQNGAAAFSTTAVGTVVNSPPARSLDSVAGGLLEPLALAVDRVHDELMVVTNGPDQSVEIFPRLATGSPTPRTTIAGPSNTTLHGMALRDVAVDESNGEYWINNGNALDVFSRTQIGDVAPVRAISGTNTNIGIFNGLAFDSKAGKIIMGSYDGGTNAGTLQSWPSSTSGNVAPSATAMLSIGNVIASLTIDFAHDQIFASALGQVSALPRVFTTGPLAATSSFQSQIAPSVVDSEGAEIYGLLTASSGTAQIAVFPTSATGTPAPTRIVQGTATRLNRPKALAICN